MLILPVIYIQACLNDRTGIDPEGGWLGIITYIHAYIHTYKQCMEVSHIYLFSQIFNAKEIVGLQKSIYI